MTPTDTDRRFFGMMVMVLIMLAITDVDEHDGDHNEADN